MVIKTDRLVIRVGDCLEVMRARLSDCSIDAIVTDPPYGLGVGGKSLEWGMPPGEEWARECLRVLKPGGHLLAMGSTRTWHRLAVAIEDAGFELRDSIAWLYGSGFPKSLDVSKAIDKAEDRPTQARCRARSALLPLTAPATPEAEKWAGWGTALKPAFEPIVVGRKPLIGTVAANVLAHGTGALNIDACRIETTDKLGGGQSTVGKKDMMEGWDRPWMRDEDAREASRLRSVESVAKAETLGRWPANVVLDEAMAEVLDEQSGTLISGANPTRRNSDKLRDTYGEFKGQTEIVPIRGLDTGGASRFYYVAKAPASERPKSADGKGHPTVKPVALMRWLVRLVTPPDGLILDPFLGSGTTAQAALEEGFRCYGIEHDPDYLPLILKRLGLDESS